MYTNTEQLLFLTAVSGFAFDSVKDLGYLVAEEEGYYCGRRFACAETVVVSCRSDGYAKKLLIVVYCLDDCTQKEKELSVFIGRFSRLKKVNSRVGRDNRDP